MRNLSFIVSFLFLTSQTVLFTNVFAQNVKTYIPPQAVQYYDTIKYEQKRIFPELPYTEYIPGLIEHESCLSLKHSRCWNPKSKLQSKRELGIGLPQLTKAYNKDGSIRFDIISDLKKRHSMELRELSWENVETRPDLQIRAMMLLSKSNYSSLYSIKDSYQRLAMADAAYNGGLSGLNKERRYCSLTKGCNPQLWFDNVEDHCLKSKKSLYSGRSACDINRHHVKDVLTVRMPKYKNDFN